MNEFNPIFDLSVPNPQNGGNFIRWQLEDFSGTAFTSDALVLPVLGDFQSQFGLFIRSQNSVGDFFHITTDVILARLGDGDFISGEVDGDSNISGFVDQSDFFSNGFTDQHLGGTTFGTILSRDGLIIEVTDATSPADGVRAKVIGGGDETAQLFKICDFVTPSVVELSKGDDVLITCGSIKLEVLEGEVPVIIDEGAIIVTAPAGSTAIIKEVIGDNIEVINASTETSGPIIVTTGGQEIPVILGDDPVAIEIGIIVSNINPVLAAVNTEIDLTSQITNFASGGIGITGADFSIDGGPFDENVMAAADGTFDQETENVVSSSSLNFNEAGVHNVCVRGRVENVTEVECILLAIYDPEGGFVTGGGWINSPEGAYMQDITLTGKANFGFVSKYKKGTTIPTGQTEFQFKVGNLNFRSDNYDWLVVAGARAQFKGTGTINGTGYYGFMLTAIDGEQPGGNGMDRFRNKIWDAETDEIVYDNQAGSDDTEVLTTTLGGGSIVIHKAK